MTGHLKVLLKPDAYESTEKEVNQSWVASKYTVKGILHLLLSMGNLKVLSDSHSISLTGSGQEKGATIVGGTVVVVVLITGRVVVVVVIMGLVVVVVVVVEVVGGPVSR